MIRLRQLRHLLNVAALYLLLSAPAHGQAPPTDYSGTCSNGAPAREARYCPFIVQYNKGAGTLSPIVRELLGVSHASDTRLIGFIIAIDDYPKIPGHNLSAAAADARNLQNFLTNDQKFDEVIFLRNADATVDNINYFLEDYLPNHADDYRGSDGKAKARLLIAYSGHGRPQTPSSQAAFILSSADDPNGSSGIYKMTNFTADVSSLASHYFHVLTLINACFGANIFTPGDRGAAGVPNGPGSFAITAGSPKNEVQALIPQRGSLFFDLIVNGIKNGDADTQSGGFYLTDGTSVTSHGGLTLSLPLYNYLSGSFYKINSIQTKADPHFLSLSAPYFGPVQEGSAEGGFFFISGSPSSALVSSIKPYLNPISPGSPVETASIDQSTPGGAVGSITSIGAIQGTREAVPHPALKPPSSLPPPSPDEVADSLNIPLGPISSLKGRPDIKIFKPLVIYPVKGYDLSSADGYIDWNKFSHSSLPRFLYIRAIGWAGKDVSFADHWPHAAALGVDRGAYLKFNFCLTAEQQLEQLRRLVKPAPDLLPIGIELVTPTVDQPKGSVQLGCYQRMGTTAAQDEILKLAAAIRATWGKTPMLVGNRYNLSILTDARSDTYMLQLNAYGDQGTISDRLNLGGRNPWTMWQYSGSLNVPGIGSKATGEVFFGTLAQYDEFRRGERNVALSAVQ